MENIVIVYGGKSCESDISVITALSVYHAIKNDYNVMLVYLTDGRFYTGKKLTEIGDYKPFVKKRYKEVSFKNGKMIKRGLYARGKKVDCALVCCHGGQGENGSLSGLLEIADIPYTCCGPMQSAVCMDKVFTKYLLKYFHFPILPFRSYKSGAKLPKMIEYPVIIKPASLGSSIGIGFASDDEEVIKKIDEALQFDNKVLIEKALRGYREFTCAVMACNETILCSQIEEVIAPDSFYSFDEKYMENKTKRIYPAEISSEVSSKIEGLCKKIYLYFELKGVVRIDFLEKDGKLYVNEINSVPGSLSWYLFKNLGFDLGALCRNIIVEAIKKKEGEKKLFTDFESDVLRRFSCVSKGTSKIKGQ